MSFVSYKIRTGGEARELKAGDSELNPVVITLADADATLTTNQLSAGAIVCPASAARTLTLPTAAQVIAAFPDMNIGDCLAFSVTSSGANSAVVAVGANITNIGAAGSLTVATATSRRYLLRKDSSTAMSLLQAA
jgi:hypothetical protein